MTYLRLADESHSVRAPVLTGAQHADLQHAALRVLGPAREALAELADAIQRGRHDLLIPAERRLLAVGLCAKDHADALEKENA